MSGEGFNRQPASAKCTQVVEYEEEDEERTIRKYNGYILMAVLQIITVSIEKEEPGVKMMEGVEKKKRTGLSGS